MLSSIDIFFICFFPSPLLMPVTPSKVFTKIASDVVMNLRNSAVSDGSPYSSSIDPILGLGSVASAHQVVAVRDSELVARIVLLNSASSAALRERHLHEC